MCVAGVAVEGKVGGWKLVDSGGGGGGGFPGGLLGVPELGDSSGEAGWHRGVCM